MKKILIAILLIAIAIPAQACCCGSCLNDPKPISNPSPPPQQPTTIPLTPPPQCVTPTNPINPPQYNIPTNPINPPQYNIPIIPINPPQIITPTLPTFNFPFFGAPNPSTPTQPSCPSPPPTTPTPPNNCRPPLSNQFTLTFQYACRPNVAFQSCLGEVAWNDNLIYSVVPSDYKWHSFSITVNARQGRNYLQFAGAGVSDTFGLLIDSVSLVRQGTNDNIVVNGDFSSPNVQTKFGFFNDISGWLGSDIEIGYYTNYGTGSGQLCELDGNANYQITQYFQFDSLYNLVPNSAPTCSVPPTSTITYKLEFDWAVRTSLVSGFDTSKGNVLWNNAVVGSLGYNGNTNINHATINVPLSVGDNILSFDGTSFGDAFGITIDNVKLTSAYNSTNLIVNGGFTPPSDTGDWKYFDGGIQGWYCQRAEVGRGNYYNPAWGCDPVIELDVDTNRRYTQVITISQDFFNSQLPQGQLQPCRFDRY